MNTQILINEFCNYSHFTRGLSTSTIKRYKENVLFFFKTLDIKSADEIDEDKVRYFFTYGRTSRNWGANTFVTYQKSLIVFFRWCIKHQYLKQNFAEQIEAPKIRRLARKKLSQTEAQKVLDTVRNYPFHSKFLAKRNTAIIAMFLYTGIRKSELLNLQLLDINLEEQLLTVSTSKREGFRVIPIPLKLNRILHEYLIERQLRKKVCPEFFCSFNLNMGITDSGLKRIIEKITKASRVSFSCHILRHTFATLMLEGGCDLFSLSKMMGHKDIHSTCIYLAASKRHLIHQMNSHPLS